MRRRSRNVQPVVESIERKMLLSTGGGVGPVTGPVYLPPPVGPVRMDAALHGHYSARAASPDAGPTYRLRGSGLVAGIGHVRTVGEVQGLGFIEQGTTQGNIVLKRPGGTITLHLTSLGPQGGFQGVAGIYAAGITGATGRYQRWRGYGSATLTTTAARHVVGGPLHQQGRFLLVLAPKALPL